VDKPRLTVHPAGNKRETAEGIVVKAWALLTCALAAAWGAERADAQRAGENAVRSAYDAFGVSVGNERVGLYTDRDARGFSPVSAGNVRIDGLYFDIRSNFPNRLVASSQIKVGLSAQGYAFPAPTGIVDYSLRAERQDNSVSVFGQVGPLTSYSAEIDGFVRVSDTISISAGANVRREETIEDIPIDSSWGAGFVTRWRPSQQLDVAGFYGRGERHDIRATPLVFTSGPFLPPDIEPTGFAQDWTEFDGYIESYGAYGRLALSDAWTLRTGLFRYNTGAEGLVSDLFLRTDAAGRSALHRVTKELPNEQRSLSGEARLTGVFEGDTLRHTVHVSLRGRDLRRFFGGTAAVNLPTPAQIGVRVNEPAPTTWAFGQQARDEVTHTAAGVAYALARRGWGEASVSVQQTFYEKTVTPPAGAPETLRDEPLFVNGALALTPTKKLALYASITRGLEEAPPAPENAVNAQQAPPAIETQQLDFGLRYALTPRLRMILGYFSIEKPYFNLDGAQLYRQLGQERHAGIEASLTGALRDDLNVIVGVVQMEPEVNGPDVDAGLIGDRPVSQPDTTIKVNFDYRPSWLGGSSLDLAWSYASERAATMAGFAALGGEQLETEAFATLDLGGRYRFQIGDNPATLRVQVQNVADAFAWQVHPSGALYQSNPRGVLATLAIDY
jgi:hypothetical protein